jgi:hypothetical protein
MANERFAGVRGARKGRVFSQKGEIAKGERSSILHVGFAGSALEVIWK